MSVIDQFQANLESETSNAENVKAIVTRELSTKQDNPGRS